MNDSTYELLFAYARLGVQNWKSKSRDVKNQARLIGVDIAEHEALAARALAKPFDPSSGNGDAITLIPMPSGRRRVYGAFFAPWRGGSVGREQLSFDLVVLSQKGLPIAFRFEPGVGRGTHGYDHVQLSESLGKRSAAFGRLLSPVPTSYPAVPLPSQDAETRFLSMVVAMHGFPRGVDDVLEDAFKGDSRKRKNYLEMTKAMFR